MQLPPVILLMSLLTQICKSPEQGKESKEQARLRSGHPDERKSLAKMKNWVLENPWSLVALITVSLAVIGWSWRTPAFREAQTYYFDLQNGELFVAAPQQISPIPGPNQGVDTPVSERAGVRAYVFACEQCQDPADRFVGWVEIDHPQSVERIRSHHPGLSDASILTITAMMPDAVLIRPAEPYAPGVSGHWHADDSLEARALRTSLKARCGGKQPVRCVP